jgi:hypothetical protein
MYFTRKFPVMIATTLFAMAANAQVAYPLPSAGQPVGVAPIANSAAPSVAQPAAAAFAPSIGGQQPSFVGGYGMPPPKPCDKPFTANAQQPPSIASVAPVTAAKPIVNTLPITSGLVGMQPAIQPAVGVLPVPSSVPVIGGAVAAIPTSTPAVVKPSIAPAAAPLTQNAFAPAPCDLPPYGKPVVVPLPSAPIVIPVRPNSVTGSSAPFDDLPFCDEVPSGFTPIKVTRENYGSMVQTYGAAAAAPQKFNAQAPTPTGLTSGTGSTGGTNGTVSGTAGTGAGTNATVIQPLVSSANATKPATPAGTGNNATNNTGIVNSGFNPDPFALPDVVPGDVDAGLPDAFQSVSGLNLNSTSMAGHGVKMGVWTTALAFAGVVLL